MATASTFPTAFDQHIQMRDAALRVVNEFRASLDTVRQPEMVTRLIGETVSRLEPMQVEHPRHFAKSLSRLANLARGAGYVDEALALLRWAEARALLDQYLLDDMVRCHVAARNLSALESTADLAVRLRLDPSYALASLVHAHSGRGDTARVRSYCGRAVRSGIGSDLTFALLIDSCGWSDIGLATSLFDTARLRGVAREGTYAALTAMYARAGDVAAVELLFAEARDRRVLSSRLYRLIVKAYGHAHRLGDAVRLFDEAVSRGFADSRSYATLIQLYIDHHQLRRARQRLRCAVETGNADEECFARMIRAYGQAGHVQSARKLNRLARERRRRHKAAAPITAAPA